MITQSGLVLMGGKKIEGEGGGGGAEILDLER